MRARCPAAALPDPLRAGRESGLHRHIFGYVVCTKLAGQFRVLTGPQPRVFPAYDSEVYIPEKQTDEPDKSGGKVGSFAGSMFGVGRSLLSYTADMTSYALGRAAAHWQQKTVTHQQKEEVCSTSSQHHAPMFVTNFARAVFAHMDTDGDGVIARAQFESTMLRGLSLVFGEAGHSSMHEAQAAAIAVLGKHLDGRDAGVNLTVFLEFMKQIVDIKLGAQGVVTPLEGTDLPDTNVKTNLDKLAINTKTETNIDTQAKPTTEQQTHTTTTTTTTVSPSNRGQRLGEFVAMVKLLPIVRILERVLAP